MTKKNRRRNAAKAKRTASAAASVPSQSKPKVGLLVTDELQKAIDQCRAKVERIAKDCRAKNRRFRDIEFELDNDPGVCLFGLVSKNDSKPTDASRVPDIFPEPRFFADGGGYNDIVQGNLGDCWFLAALSAASFTRGLIEKFCVARDEKVGVYGFVFFKNGSWVNVIIDDLLYINIPKFEELSSAEQALFHNDRYKYNRTARKGGKNLYFARSGAENETWVPLIEKAYAKLHGDYASLEGGKAAEGLEDLTGGVSSMILIKDILDTDQFWEEELLKANVDRLFSASYAKLDTTRSGKSFIAVEGLIGRHAYSILKAVEVAGKRFVLLRNPWGVSGWKGPWSDGSKEWTTEWLMRLPEIGHVFGDDGQFIMEYSDFLERFEDMDRTILFDESWKMSMEWLRVPTRPPPAAWSYGDVSFNFTLAEPTRAVIVLSRLDERYFKGIEGRYVWSLQFLVYKIGDEDSILVAESEQPVAATRSVNTEVNLEPGNYAVLVRMEGLFETEPPDPENFCKRKLARVLTQRAEARLAASNYDPSMEKENLPIHIDVLVGREKAIASARAKASAEAVPPEPSTEAVPPEPSTEAVSSEPSTESVSSEPSTESVSPEPSTESTSEETSTESVSSEPIVGDAPEDVSAEVEAASEEIGDKEKETNEEKEKKEESHEQEPTPGSGSESTTDSGQSGSKGGSESGKSSEGSPSTSSDSNSNADKSPGDCSDKNSKESESNEVFIGLRIYTQGAEQVAIVGATKEEVDKLLAPTVCDSAASGKC